MREMSRDEFCKKETVHERSPSPLVPCENVESPQSLTELPNLTLFEDIYSARTQHHIDEAVKTTSHQETTDFPSIFSPDETELNETDVGCQIENTNLKRTLPRHSQSRILSSDPKLSAVSERESVKILT